MEVCNFSICFCFHWDEVANIVATNSLSISDAVMLYRVIVSRQGYAVKQLPLDELFPKHDPETQTPNSATI